MTRITIKNIFKRFGGEIVLKGINLEVKSKEYFTLLGPSGAGKSTLLNIIAGLVKPDNGKIFFDGLDVTNSPPEKRKVGYVFQTPALFPHLNTWQNIMFGLEPIRELGKKEKIKRVKNVIELLGLTGHEKKYPSQLSGGQKQRVSLARAIVTSPRLLLLDEPFSALDATLRINLRSEVKQIQKELGITAIHVTHDQEEAFAISDRIGLLIDGKILQVDTPKNIYYRPASLKVATFLRHQNVIPLKEIQKNDKILEKIRSNHGKTNLNDEQVIIIPAELIKLEKNLISPYSKNNLFIKDSKIFFSGRVKWIEFLGHSLKIKFEMKLSRHSQEFIALLSAGERVERNKKYLFSIDIDDLIITKGDNVNEKFVENRATR